MDSSVVDRMATLVIAIDPVRIYSSFVRNTLPGVFSVMVNLGSSPGISDFALSSNRVRWLMHQHREREEAHVADLLDLGSTAWCRKGVEIKQAAEGHGGDMRERGLP